MMKHQEYFSDKNLADRYGVSRSTIWRWVGEKRLPQPQKLSEGTTRWSRDAIEKLDARRTSAA